MTPSLSGHVRLAALAAMILVPLSAGARNIAVPADDPSAMVTVPDDWKTEEIEYGMSAVSPDKDVFFSVESAGKDDVEAMLKNNKTWMKENKIDGDVEPKKSEMDFNGLSGSVFRFDTTDDEGPTRVDFVVLPGGKNRVVFLTLWASAVQRKSHGAEIDKIMGSIKPLQ